MDDAILLISFDINSSHEHEETNKGKNASSEAQMETPERIFDEFFSKHKNKGRRVLRSTKTRTLSPIKDKRC